MSEGASLLGIAELRSLLPLSRSFGRLWPVLLGLAVLGAVVEALALSFFVILLGLVLGDTHPTGGALARILAIAGIEANTQAVAL